MCFPHQFLRKQIPWDDRKGKWVHCFSVAITKSLTKNNSWKTGFVLAHSYSGIRVSHGRKAQQQVTGTEGGRGGWKITSSTPFRKRTRAKVEVGSIYKLWKPTPIAMLAPAKLYLLNFLWQHHQLEICCLNPWAYRAVVLNPWVATPCGESYDFFIQIIYKIFTLWFSKVAKLQL